MVQTTISKAVSRKRILTIIRILNKLYPEAKCSLLFHTPWELLVSTILSAQCTDKRVNEVTPVLFRRFPTVQAMGRADPSELEKIIRSTGFFRQKARSILATAKAILRDHQGEVPSRMEELVRLRGVGRKTANVVLGNAFGIPALAVDTHVLRLSFRIGLSLSDDPVQVEKDLIGIVPGKNWALISHLLIWHGRAVCTARRPRCLECAIVRYCEQKLTRDRSSSRKRT